MRRTLSVFVNRVGDVDEDIRNQVVHIHLESSFGGLPSSAPYERSKRGHALYAASSSTASTLARLGPGHRQSLSAECPGSWAGGGQSGLFEASQLAPDAACAVSLWPPFPEQGMPSPAEREADGVRHGGQVVYTFQDDSIDPLPMAEQSMKERRTEEQRT